MVSFIFREKTDGWHAIVIGRGWTPFDSAAKAREEELMTYTYVEALRRLAPNMGAYVNEVRFSLFSR
jgi:hypothetical protein